MVDVFVCFCRVRGLLIIYICGFDEYGIVIEIKVFLEGVDFVIFCVKYYVIYKEIYDWFWIDFDIFGCMFIDEYIEIV